MTGQTNPRDSLGAAFGRGRVAMSLGSRDPRLRRNAQAQTTDAELGAGLKRTDDGRQALDFDAIEAEMLRRGFKK